MAKKNLCKNYVIFIFSLPILFLTYSVKAQHIENLSLEQAGAKIIIHYDFVADNPNNTYQLKVYQSIDNFSKPINLAKGDIGDKVSPGNGKTIVWYAREELGTFKGELIIEIRVFQSPENIYIQSPATKSKIKRGSALNISWSGGINENKVSIQLLREGKVIEPIANRIENNGLYNWTTAKDIKPGKNYSIRITGAGSNGVQSTSSQFAINRKIPVWLLVAPVAVIGAVVAVIITSGDSGSENNNLPGAPDPN